MSTIDFTQARDISDLRTPPPARQSVQYLLTEHLRSLLQGMSQFSLHNDPEAAALVGRIQDFAVGPDGPRLKWKTADAKFNDRVGRLWDRYFHEIGPGSIDCRRLHTGPYLLRQVIHGWMMSGRCAAMICGTKGGAATDATGGVQMIDGLRIRNDLSRMDDDSLVAGVELGPHGEPVAINVADWVRAGMYLNVRTRRVGAGFVYLPNPLASDFDTIAPAPALSLVVPSLVWTQQVMQSVVFATLKEAALNAYVISQPTGASVADTAAANTAAAGENASGLRTSDRGGTEYAATSPALEYLAEGESIEFGPSNYPSEALPTFIKEISSRIASSYGLTRATLTGEWQGSSFTQARLELQFVGQRMAVIQRAFEREFLLPLIRRAFVPAMIVRGELGPALPEGWDRPEFTHNAMPEADPSKTAVRHLTELKSFDRDLQQIADERGIGVDELIVRMARDAKALADAGLAHPAGQAGQAGQIRTNESPGERAGGDRAGGGAAGEGTDDQGNTADGGGSVGGADA